MKDVATGAVRASSDEVDAQVNNETSRPSRLRNSLGHTFTFFNSLVVSTGVLAFLFIVLPPLIWGVTATPVPPGNLEGVVPPHSLVFTAKPQESYSLGSFVKVQEKSGESAYFISVIAGGPPVKTAQNGEAPRTTYVLRDSPEAALRGPVVQEQILGELFTWPGNEPLALPLLGVFTGLKSLLLLAPALIALNVGVKK